MKFGTLQQMVKQIAVSWPKIEIFKIQDGGGRHLENRFFGHNSLTVCPISAKFCMRKHNGTSTRTTRQKLQVFKIQDGGRPPFWKSLNRHISVKNRPISMKFGTLHQIFNPMTITWPKIEIFKIQDGGGRHRKRSYSISNIGNMMGCNHQSCVQVGPFADELSHFEYFPTTTVRHFKFKNLIFDLMTVTAVLTCCCIPNFIKIGSCVRPTDAHNCRMFNAPLLFNRRRHGNQIVGDMSVTWWDVTTQVGS